MDWKMVYTKQELMAEALGVNAALYNQSEIETFALLESSGVLLGFEKNQGRFTVGAAGRDLILMAKTRLGLPASLKEIEQLIEGKDITDPIEYWIGYALGYLQGRSGWTFKQIFEYFPLESWRDMYILHEVGDETLWDKTLGPYFKLGREEKPDIYDNERVEQREDYS